MFYYAIASSSFYYYFPQDIIFNVKLSHIEIKMIDDDGNFPLRSVMFEQFRSMMMVKPSHIILQQSVIY